MTAAVRPLRMVQPYSEAAYFDGYHVQHIADWEERNRVLRAHREATALIRGRRNLASLQTDVREVITRADGMIRSMVA